MRVRTRITGDSPQQIAHYGFAISGDCNSDHREVYSATGYTTYLGSTTSVETHDVITPNYKRLMRAGRIINNPFWSQKVVVKDDIINWDTEAYDLTKIYCSSLPRMVHTGWRTKGSISASHWCTLGDTPMPETRDKQDLIDLAVISAWAQRDQKKADVLVTLAEAKQTYDSFYQLFYKLIKLYRKIKKLRIKELKKELSFDELADRWMEIRYAFRPFYYDAKALGEAAAELFTEKPKRVTSRGSARDSATETIETSFTDAGHHLKWNVRKTVTKDVSVYAGVLDHIIDFNGAQTFGLHDIPEAIWDLVPFSFVADWFLNVGDMIAAWNPVPGLSTLASWVTVKTTETHVYTLLNGEILPSSPYYSQVNDVSNATYTKVITTKERIPNPQRPFSPTFSVNLSTAKILDLVIMAKKLSQ
jgi:hypothetical protein